MLFKSILASCATARFPLRCWRGVGTAISTAAVGAGIWEAARLIGHPITFAWALEFGALISPTDPVAVLSVLKNVNVPADLEVEMQGELLFNDGVGVVLFTVLLGFASGGGENTSAAANRRASGA